MKNNERYPSICGCGIKNNINKKYFCDFENKYCTDIDLCPRSEEYEEETNRLFKEVFGNLLNK